MNDFDILAAASSGMRAQRAAMDIEARNVALAQTGDARHPAYGLVPDFASVVAGSGTPGDGEEADVAAFESGFAEVSDEPSSGSAVRFTGAHVSSAPLDSITEMISVLDTENAFINGTGGLQEMVFERAKADVLVSIATAASSRATQSLTQIQL